MKHASCYQKDYPRPQFVRKNWTNLNGKWDFVFDDQNIGEKECWFNNFPKQTQIKVPFSYQTEASGVCVQERHDNVWYQRRVEYDRKQLKNNKLLLWFEGSDYITKVWVNGRYVGKHIGGYCRFSFDVTNDVLQGDENNYVLTVKCEDTYDATQPRGKQKCVKDPVGCWYMETNGLWKTVWTEVVSSTRLEHIKFTPNKDTYALDFEVAIAGDLNDCLLQTEILTDGNIISQCTLKVVRDKFSFSLDAVNDADLFRLVRWNLDKPSIFDLKFTVIKNGKIVDEVGSYVGFRAFYVERDTIVMNSCPTYLRMVLEQGYFQKTGMTYADEQAIIDELTLIKSLGFNGVRMHQKIEDERFFYYADIMGIGTWVEMPSPYEFRDNTVDRLTTEWMEVVKQFYNHPSVLAWVPFNESWGVPRVLTNDKEQNFTLALYYLTKAYDNMRPVISNDGWEHTESDIITLHNYEQDPDELGEFYQDIENILNGANMPNYTQIRKPIVGGHKYRGQPIMITEFAGIGFNVQHTQNAWGYGSSVQDQQHFVSRLMGMIERIRQNNRICGFCVTQITDVYQEINGLADMDRKLKADVDSLKKVILS